MQVNDGSLQTDCASFIWTDPDYPAGWSLPVGGGDRGDLMISKLLL